MWDKVEFEARRLVDAGLDVLVLGPPGVGKTHLAKTLAQDAEYIDASLAGTGEVLSAVIVNRRIILDEIHRAGDDVKWLIKSILDGEFSQKAEIEKPQLIACAHEIEDELRSRFHIVHVSYWSDDELEKLVRTMLPDADNNTIETIVRMSRGLPRYAKKLVERYKAGVIIPKYLWPDEMAYIEAILRHGNRASSKHLRMMLATGGEIEGNLIRAGYLRVTSRGREVTESGLIAYTKELKEVQQ